MGRCPGCGEWNTFAEERADNSGRLQEYTAIGGQKPQLITELPLLAEDRFSAGLIELDRVLGGGIVPGSVILLGGDPGIGKSTLLLQVAGQVARKGTVLYVSGEESVKQIGLRASRLGASAEGLYVLAESELNAVEYHMRHLKPELVVIDSIQTMYNPDLSSAPGSIGQVRDCSSRLTRLAKNINIPVFFVGHVTKDGSLAGPRVLEHMVDTVLYFEGERHQMFRILRGVKNRFGSTNEIGVFEMQEQGLVEVNNPSSLFMMAHPCGSVPGAVVVPVMEGTRPLLVEIQALVSSTGFSTPRRMTAGIDYNRLALLIAVLEKRVGLLMGNYDAYVNVVGGVRIDEPAVDLAVALALASSFRDYPVDCRTAAVGEIGLTGEIRPVNALERRVREAGQLGFKRCLVPAANHAGAKIGEVELLGVNTLVDAIEIALKA
jgi:DNA repair protein RadA/Sms